MLKLSNIKITCFFYFNKIGSLLLLKKKNQWLIVLDQNNFMAIKFSSHMIYQKQIFS